jgi:putative phosphotransacetylase
MKNPSMQKAEVARLVTERIIRQTYAETGKRFVPAAGSNRHIHLCQAYIEALFGRGYELKPLRPLSQPGQFAAEETVSIQGPKGRIDNVRVLGPCRSKTQVEIFITDAYKLGITPVIRLSGDTENTPGARIIGPKGSVDATSGFIVAARHVHISQEQSSWLGLANGDRLSIRKDGERPLVFENVPVRCGEDHELELHLDLEEANAGCIQNGEILEIIATRRQT